MPHQLTWLLALVGCLLGQTAWANPEGTPFEWSEPVPEVQLERDETPIPLGKGAVFVPAMTDPLNEPSALLVDETTDDVVSIPTGERVLVDPGNYVVVVTSGSPRQGVGQAVTVTEGDTALVPVKWGALRIEVVDDRRVPHRGGYELIRADNREAYGVGFGADTLQGEKLRTWLLPPGVYRIVRQGSNYRALRDFATVYVPPSGFVRYRLVLDPDTGEFQGSGVLLPNEFGSPKETDGRWFSSLIVGAVGSLAQQSNVVGVNNQLTLAGSLFVDGQFAYNGNRHSANLLMQIEEGASWIQPDEGPSLVVKTRDRIRLDALYTFFVQPRIGPYVRAAAETQALDTELLVTERTAYQQVDPAGNAIGEPEIYNVNDRFFVADAWAPTIIREGVGLNTRLLNSRHISLNWRVGVGIRQNLFNDAAVILDTVEQTVQTGGGAEVSSVTRYRRVDNLFQEGVESTVVATARIGGWAVYATNLELFAEFDDLRRPIVEWRNTLNLRLTRNLSFIYFVDIQRLPQVVEQTQLQQSVLMRASWAIL